MAGTGPDAALDPREGQRELNSGDPQPPPSPLSQEDSFGILGQNLDLPAETFDQDSWVEPPVPQGQSASHSWELVGQESQKQQEAGPLLVGESQSTTTPNRPCAAPFGPPPAPLPPWRVPSTSMGTTLGPLGLALSRTSSTSCPTFTSPEVSRPPPASRPWSIAAGTPGPLSSASISASLTRAPPGYSSTGAAAPGGHPTKQLPAPIWRQAILTEHQRSLVDILSQGAQRAPVATLPSPVTAWTTSRTSSKAAPSLPGTATAAQSGSWRRRARPPPARSAAALSGETEPPDIFPSDEPLVPPGLSEWKRRAQPPPGPSSLRSAGGTGIGGGMKRSRPAGGLPFWRAAEDAADRRSDPPQLWGGGGVHEEKRRYCDEAAARLLALARWLEANGVTLGIRSLAETDEELQPLLLPRRPGTALRHVRLLERYQRHLEPVISRAREEGLDPPPVLVQKSVMGWFTELKDAPVGAATLTFALQALSHAASIFDINTDVHRSPVLRSIARAWLDSKGREPRKARPYTKRFCRWLEFLVHDVTASPQDRLMAGRQRIAVGASLRNHDLRNTPIGRGEAVLHEDGRLRGLRTRATETKTVARPWIVSVLGVTPEGDGWLEVALELLKAAHGKGLVTDDHFGKSCNASRDQWLASPPKYGSDSIHVRTLMAESAWGDGDQIGFSPGEVAAFRLHGAKPTLTSLAMHRKVGERAIRVMGGWKGRVDESMPDAYLRDSQNLALEAQEEVLGFLGHGGDLQSLTTVPIVDLLFEGSGHLGQGSHQEAHLPEEVTSSDTGSVNGTEAEDGDAGEPVHSVEWLTTNHISKVYHHAIRDDERGTLVEPDEEGPPREGRGRAVLFSQMCGRPPGKRTLLRRAVDGVIPQHHSACALCFNTGDCLAEDECRHICNRASGLGRCARRVWRRCPPPDGLPSPDEAMVMDLIHLCRAHALAEGVSFPR